jgi:hypothetical protein
MPSPIRRIGLKLEPWGPDSIEEMRLCIPDGGICNIKYLPVRDREQLEKFWALCGVVAEVSGVTKGTIRNWVSKRLGFVDEIVDIDGSKREVARSIALWGDLEEREFDEFLDLSIELFAQEIGSAPDALRNRFYEILAGRAR